MVFNLKKFREENQAKDNVKALLAAQEELQRINDANECLEVSLRDDLKIANENYLIEISKQKQLLKNQDELQNVNKNVEETNALLLTRIDKLENANEKLLSQLEVFQSDLKAEKSRTKDVETKLENVTNELQKINIEKTVLETSILQDKNALQEKAKKISESNDLLLKLEKDLCQMNDKVTNLQSNLSIKDSQIVILKNDVKELIDTKANLNLELKSLNNSLHECEKILLQKEGDMKHLQEKQEFSVQKEEQLTTTTESLKEKLKHSEDLSYRYEIDLKHCRQELNILNINKDQLQKTIENLQAQLIEVKGFHSEALSAQKRLVVSNDQLTNINRINSECLEEKEELLRGAQEEIKHNAAIIEQLKKLNNSLDIKCVELKKQLETDQTKREGLDIENSNLLKSVEKFEKQEQIMQSEVKDLKSKLDDALDDINKLKFSNVNLDGSNANLQSECEQIKCNLKHAEASLTECLTKKQEIQDALLVAKKDNEWLEKMRKDSKTQNLAQAEKIETLVKQITENDHRYEEFQKTLKNNIMKLETDLTNAHADNLALHAKISSKENVISEIKKDLNMVKEKNEEKNNALNFSSKQGASLKVENEELQGFVKQLQMEQNSIKEENARFFSEKQNISIAHEKYKSTAGKFY